MTPGIRVVALLATAASLFACAPRPAALSPAAPASPPSDSLLEEFEEIEYDFASGAAHTPPDHVL